MFCTVATVSYSVCVCEWVKNGHCDAMIKKTIRHKAKYRSIYSLLIVYDSKNIISVGGGGFGGGRGFWLHCFSMDCVTRLRE